MDPSSAQSGLSVHGGSYEEMEVDGREVNGVRPKGNGLGKRKARKSTENNNTYKEEDSEDGGDEPLVRRLPYGLHSGVSLAF